MQREDINVVFFRSTTKNYSYVEQRHLKQILEKAGYEASNLLKANFVVNIIVMPLIGSRYLKTKLKIDGHALWDSIELNIPPRQWKKGDVRGVLFHEMYHYVRIHLMQQKALLLTRIFDEGLAATFQALYVPELVCPYFQYKEKELKEYFPELKKDKYKKEYKNSDWYATKGKRKWLLYKMGVYLSKEILKHHPKINHATLLRKSTPDLLRLSAARF